MQNSQCRCKKCRSFKTFILTKGNTVFKWPELPNIKEYKIMICSDCGYEEIKEIEEIEDAE